MQPIPPKQESQRYRGHIMQTTYSTQQFLPSQRQQHLSPSQYSREYFPTAMSSSWGMPTSMTDTMGYKEIGYSGTNTQEYENSFPFEPPLDGQKSLPLRPASHQLGIPRQETQWMDDATFPSCFEGISIPSSGQADGSGDECVSPMLVAKSGNMVFQVDWSHLSKYWELPQELPGNVFDPSTMSSPMAGNASAPLDCGRSSVDVDIKRRRSPSASLTSTKTEKSRIVSRSKAPHRSRTAPKHTKGEKSQNKSRDEQSYQCPIERCTKTFARKTDLERHNKSVHIKERNHECTYCGRLFARKDTLRRHMEDGCSKRFDIETVTLQPQEMQQVFWTSLATSPSTFAISSSTLPDMYI